MELCPALFSGVRVGLFELVFMRIQKVPLRVIVNLLIAATKAGLKVTTSEIETHYLAGGHVPSMIRALISADKAYISLTFKQATAIDLAGRDVFEAVQISVNPKVINTPSVAAVAADGIQLIAKARVTVRANIQQLVGGAGEVTILAQVGEGIVTSIGSAKTHKEVLESWRLGDYSTIRTQCGNVKRWALDNNPPPSAWRLLPKQY